MCIDIKKLVSGSFVENGSTHTAFILMETVYSMLWRTCAGNNMVSNNLDLQYDAKIFPRQWKQPETLLRHRARTMHTSIILPRL